MLRFLSNLSCSKSLSSSRLYELGPPLPSIAHIFHLAKTSMFSTIVSTIQLHLSLKFNMIKNHSWSFEIQELAFIIILMTFKSTKLAKFVNLHFSQNIFGFGAIALHVMPHRASPFVAQVLDLN